MPKNVTAYGGDLECGYLKRNLFVSTCPNVNIEENMGTSPLFIMVVL